MVLYTDRTENRIKLRKSLFTELKKYHRITAYSKCEEETSKISISFRERYKIAESILTEDIRTPALSGPNQTRRPR